MDDVNWFKFSLFDHFLGRFLLKFKERFIFATNLDIVSIPTPFSLHRYDVLLSLSSLDNFTSPSNFQLDDLVALFLLFIQLVLVGGADVGHLH